MVTFPIADGARMPGIHPRTFHHWLTKANIPFTSHPTDARIKCVTLDHHQHLARVSGRRVPSFPTTDSGIAEEQVLLTSEHEAEPLQIAHEVPIPFPHEATLLQKLSCQETRVVTLQERERAVERQLSTLETVITELVGSTGSSASIPDAHGPDVGRVRASTPPGATSAQSSQTNALAPACLLLSNMLRQEAM
jgi:hypothetical protein